MANVCCHKTVAKKCDGCPYSVRDYTDYRVGYDNGYFHAISGCRPNHRVGLNPYEDGYCAGFAAGVTTGEEALRFVGAAGPLGDPDVLASPTTEQEAFCDRNCCWSGHHKDCVRYTSPTGVALPDGGKK